MLSSSKKKVPLASAALGHAQTATARAATMQGVSGARIGEVMTTRGPRMDRTNRHGAICTTGMRPQCEGLADRRPHSSHPLCPGGTPRRRRPTTIVDFRIHLLASTLTLGLPAGALAQQARPVRSAAPRVDRPLPSQGLPPGLADLPRAAEAALYAPRLADVLGDLEDLVAILKVVDPSLTRRSVPELLGQALFGGGIMFGAAGRAQPELARLASPEGLASVGVDAQGPVTALISPEAGVAVVGFELTSRPAFERWLDALGGEGRARMEVGGEQASVLDIIVSQSANDRVRLGDVAGLVRAHAALPAGAHLYGLLNTEAMARWLTREAEAYGVRAHRFASAGDRGRAQAEARALGDKVRHLAKKVEGTALGLYRGPDGLTLRTEVALTEFGAKRLAPHLRAPGEQPVVTGWALTPALARVALRVHPRTVELLGAQLGLTLPQASLTGDLALLSLGVDAECPLARARKKGGPGNLRWAFLLPSAAAVGLAGPEAADVMHRSLSQQLDAEPAPTTGGSRAHLEGRVAGSPYEVDVRDDLMLVGTGLGSGAAAQRRLSAVPKVAARADAPLLEAAVDMLAVDAAFAAGSFGADHSPELLAMEALRLTLKPLWDHVARVELTVRAEDSARRLSAQAVLRPPP